MPVPWQEFVDPAGGMTGDASQHIGEPCLRIDVIEAGGLDQGVEDGSKLTATIGSAKQPGLSAERHAAQNAFGGIVRQAYPAVVEEAGEAIPTPLPAALFTGRGLRDGGAA